MQTTQSKPWLTLYVSSVTLAGHALLAWALPSVRDNPFVVAGLLALAAAIEVGHDQRAPLTLAVGPARHVSDPGAVDRDGRRWATGRGRTA